MLLWESFHWLFNGAQCSPSYCNGEPTIHHPAWAPHFNGLSWIFQVLRTRFLLALLSFALMSCPAVLPWCPVLKCCPESFLTSEYPPFVDGGVDQRKRSQEAVTTFTRSINRAKVARWHPQTTLLFRKEKQRRMQIDEELAKPSWVPRRLYKHYARCFTLHWMDNIYASPA